MDTLTEIVSTFKPEDSTEFRRFLKRTKSNDNRKDLQLFNLVFDGEKDPKEFADLLYPEGNKVAYQASRKRLNRLLNRYIALKLIDSDSSNASAVLNTVNMARYLLSHKKNRLGWKYLKKAERLAKKNGLYEILNSVFVLQIQNLPAELSQTRAALIEEWKRNKRELEWNEKGEIALSLVSEKIQSAGESGQFEKLDELIDDTLKDLGLDQEFLLQPRFVYSITSLNRRRMLLKKDFFHLEPFIINQYNLILKNGGFAERNSYYQLGFLYMIAHTLYRNKKFREAQEYLSQLEEKLERASKGQRNEFVPRATLLKSNLLMFGEDISKAIFTLDSFVRHPGVQLSQADKLKFTVALGIAQFQDRQFRNTLKTLSRITHSDKWCAKIMGREWVLKKNLMEIILFIELEENDLVDSRLRSVQRAYRDILMQPLYQRVRVFIGFLRRIANHPTSEEKEVLKNEVEQAFEWVPMEFEDLQAVAFYAWLKSKLYGGDSYSTLLQLLKGTNDQ